MRSTWIGRAGAGLAGASDDGLPGLGAALFVPVIWFVLRRQVRRAVMTFQGSWEVSETAVRSWLGVWDGTLVKMWRFLGARSACWVSVNLDVSGVGEP